MMKILNKFFAALVMVVSITVLAAGFVMADDSAAEYTNPDTGYKVVVNDGSGLLKDKSSVVESMKPITAYANVMFLSTDSNPQTPEDYGEWAGAQVFGQGTDYTVFFIDMDNRKVCVASSKSIYQTLTTARSNTITDNVYSYASASDYDNCAISAFEQMYTILDGGNIPAPMKIIGCVLIALIAGLTVCYIIMSSKTEMKVARAKDIKEGMGNNVVDCSNITKSLVSSNIIRSSGGGGHIGGGGGGFGGGGGGFSGGGGGGSHSF